MNCIIYSAFIGIGACLQAFSSSFATLDQARHAYGVIATNPLDSVIESGGFVFLDVKWDCSVDATSEEQDEAEMSALFDALTRYIVSSNIVFTNAPFSIKMLDWLGETEIPFNIPKVPSVVVKNEKKGTDCRKVFAFEEAPLHAAREKAAAEKKKRINRTEKEWVDFLKISYQKLPDQKLKRTFMVLLGCPIVNLVLDRGDGEYGQSIVGCEQGWRELESVLAWKPEAGSFFAEHGDLLWHSILEKKERMFYPQWNEDDGGRFDEARILYSKGKDLPRILRLSAESIAINPISSKKWCYLGGALKENGNPKDGLIAYIQGAKFDHDNPYAWKGIFDCCKKAGLTSNANGLFWYLKMRGIL
ncbi:MAG: hypothetical protein IJR99_03175 [Kiritimatiellae bacterium]|nr:hypothetical protein [Kiritimatiellia bacterium]